jgi:predicted phage tail protein
MDNVKVASELVKIAKSLTASVNNLAEIKAVLPAMREKIKEFERVREEAARMTNKLWRDATQEVNDGTKELSGKIGNALVDYFNGNGMGVRKTDIGDSLVEVFPGNGLNTDGFRMDADTKVSTHISLLFDERPLMNFQLRNGNTGEVIKGELSDTNTIPKLLRIVKNADAKGFFSARR